MLRNDLYVPWIVSDDKWGVEIIDGEFSGVVLQLESVEFSEKEAGGVDVNYHIIKKPEFMEEVTGDLFQNTLELIINDILREAVELSKNDEQTGTDNFKEFDQ